MEQAWLHSEMASDLKHLHFFKFSTFLLGNAKGYYPMVIPLLYFWE
jgi:hypothetical protein